MAFSQLRRLWRYSFRSCQCVRGQLRPSVIHRVPKLARWRIQSISHDRGLRHHWDRTGTVFVGSLWQSIRWQRAYFDKAYANGNLQRRYLCPVLLHVMSNDYRHWSFHKLMSHAPFHGLGPRGEAFAHLAKCYSTLQTLFVIISLFNVGCNCKPAN